MNGAVYDSTNMFFRLRYEKAYDGMLATPLNVGDIALGEVIWALSRGALYGLGFLVVMFALRPCAVALGVLALPASMLIGFRLRRGRPCRDDLHALVAGPRPAFVIAAAVPVQRHVLPDPRLPRAAAHDRRVQPLYRGVDLVRGLTIGSSARPPDRRRLPAGDGPDRPDHHVTPPRPAAAPLTSLGVPAGRSHRTYTQHMELVVFWVLAGFILLAVELHAASFYAVFLAIGSFSAAILAFIAPDSQIWAQAILAAVVSVVGLFALRPIASRTFLKSTGGVVSRGVHGGIVGEEALTADLVGDEHHPGHVILAGERWLAVTDNSTPLEADQAVHVIALRGTTLLVRPLEHSAPFDRGGTAMEGGSAMDSGVGNG